MDRKIKIIIDGRELVADMFYDKAPLTCEAIWGMLPFEGEILPVKWSGNVFYTFSPLDLDKAECSRVFGVVPGDIVYNPHVHDAAEHPHEISFVYGEAAMYTVSGSAISNLFARVEPQYLEALKEIGDDNWKNGVKKIEISRCEE